MDTKPTNPKDIIGSGKLDLGLVPDALAAAAALAFTEGAVKYGRFNWRVAGVRASIYNAALRRHLARWWNGEDCDLVTGVPHLGSIAACVGILLDADLADKLTDDRPPPVDMAPALEQGAAVAHLRELFATHHPHQWTIADAQQPATDPAPPPAPQAPARHARSHPRKSRR